MVSNSTNTNKMNSNLLPNKQKQNNNKNPEDMTLKIQVPD